MPVLAHYLPDTPRNSPETLQHSPESPQHFPEVPHHFPETIHHFAEPPHYFPETPHSDTRDEGRGGEVPGMKPEKKTLHVNPVGENWEVESEDKTLGQAETQPEAVELAQELAEEEKAELIEVHREDGTLAKEVTVSPKVPGHSPGCP